MNKTNFEVIVQENVGGWNVRVWLINKSNRVEIARIEKGQIEWSEIKEGAIEPEPTFTMNRDLWNMLKNTLVEKHERDKSTVESELGATKYHLEDMRKLVFKGK